MSACRFCCGGALIGALILGAAPAVQAGPQCAISPELTMLGGTAYHAARRLHGAGRLTIVALGSSSTSGVGASGPAMSYPSQLQRALRRRWPNRQIRVVNRGVGGEDAPEELHRLRATVARDRPDLMIWQVGSNAVLRRDDLAADEVLIDDGVAFLRAQGVDAVLMDMQYAPRILARRGHAEMERRIAEIAKTAHIGLFRRFDIMQQWARSGQLAPGVAIGADGLHMTDAGYRCIAIELAKALTRSWRALGSGRGISAKAVALSHRD